VHSAGTYTEGMSLTATQFRKDLFSVLDRVSKGETVEITYKGSTLKVVPSPPKPKLARLKKRNYLLCDPDSIISTDHQLMAEMEAEWEKDWRDL
jgi:prevent-host-death family protein